MFIVSFFAVYQIVSFRTNLCSIVAGFGCYRSIELETALLDGCDLGQIKSICKCRPIPEHLRAEVWPICLGVQGKADSMSGFDELFDMDEQVLVREDCHGLVGASHNSP